MRGVGNSHTNLDIPPPISCYHLIIYADGQLLVLIVPFWHILYGVLEGGISDQLLHALDWVLPSELHLFH
jgi:hypothetical protein